MKKSHVLMWAAIEAYRSGGPDGFRSYYRSLTQYEHAALAVLGNEVMAGSWVRRPDDWTAEKRCETFIRFSVEGVPLAYRRRARQRKPPAPLS